MSVFRKAVWQFFREHPGHPDQKVHDPTGRRGKGRKTEDEEWKPMGRKLGIRMTRGQMKASVKKPEDKGETPRVVQKGKSLAGGRWGSTRGERALAWAQARAKKGRRPISSGRWMLGDEEEEEKKKK